MATWGQSGSAAPRRRGWRCPAAGRRRLAPPFVATAVEPREQQPPVMIRDPRLDELLAAHGQYGNTTALQMPAGSAQRHL